MLLYKVLYIKGESAASALSALLQMSWGQMSWLKAFVSPLGQIKAAADALDVIILRKHTFVDLFTLMIMFLR